MCATQTDLIIKEQQLKVLTSNVQFLLPNEHNL